MKIKCGCLAALFNIVCLRSRYNGMLSYFLVQANIPDWKECIMNLTPDTCHTAVLDVLLCLIYGHCQLKFISYIIYNSYKCTGTHKCTNSGPKTQRNISA